MNGRVTCAPTANTIVRSRKRVCRRFAGQCVRAAGRHNQKESVMGKGNKVRKKEVKKPKQDKKATIKK
jgi:hypothetical protein